MSDDEPPCVTFLVRHAWLSMRTALAGALIEHGLSVAQYGTLLMLLGEDGPTVAEIARKVGTARQSANELLTAMARAGLIERRAHPDDRRSQQVFITAAGRSRVAAAQPAVHRMEAQLQASLSETDRAAAHRWLTRMAESAPPSGEELPAL